MTQTQTPTEDFDTQEAADDMVDEIESYVDTFDAERFVDKCVTKIDADITIHDGVKVTKNYELVVQLDRPKIKAEPSNGVVSVTTATSNDVSIMPKDVADKLLDAARNAEQDAVRSRQ
jgi:hypothetical protein